MQKKKRYCLVKGHEKLKSQYMCTYKQCDFEYRWICSDCLIKQSHNHGQQQLDHIIKEKEFLNYLTNYQQKLCDKNSAAKKYIQLCIIQLQEFIVHLEQFLLQLNGDLIKIDNYYNQLLKIAQNDLFILSNEDVNRILHFDFNYNEQNTIISEELLVSIRKLCKEVDVLIQNNDESFQIMQINQQENKQKYDYYADFKGICKNTICTLQVSNNQKILVLGGYDQQLQIIDLQNKKILKCIKYDNIIVICRFTYNSKFLLFGDSKGYLYCSEFDDKQNFQDKFKNKLHSDWIFDIKVIDNSHILTCSGDLKIKILNIKSNQEFLSIIDAHNKIINGIDYDYFKDIIFSCSNDKSIKLFDRYSGKLYLSRENAHNDQIYQIQLINNQKLISSNYDNLILWQIDYAQRLLTKINVINEHLYNFTYQINSNTIIIVLEKTAQILDINFNQVATIPHSINKFDWFTRSLQVDSINYIVITGQNDIEILKRL